MKYSPEIFSSNGYSRVKHYIPGAEGLVRDTVTIGELVDDHDADERLEYEAEQEKKDLALEQRQRDLEDLANDDLRDK